MSQVALYSDIDNIPTDTLYNYFQSHNVLAKQHFVEWFSGDAIDSIWTEITTTGSPTFSMVDEINGGYEIDNINTVSDGSLTFNQINQYARDGCVMIGRIYPNIISSYFVYMGMCGNDQPHAAGNCYSMRARGAVGNWELISKNSTPSETILDTGIARVNDVDVLLKLEVLASSVNGYVDGILGGSNTASTPIADLQPVFQSNCTAVTGADRRLQIKYCEVFNT